MIQIDEPPDKPYCAQCGEPITWGWFPRRNAWVAFVACGCERWSLKPHGCRHAQDPKTWKQLDRGDPPSSEYLEFRNKSATRSDE